MINNSPYAARSASGAPNTEPMALPMNNAATSEATVIPRAAGTKVVAHVYRDECMNAQPPPSRIAAMPM